MRPVLPQKRKLIDLVVLVALDLIFLFLWKNPEMVILFSLGYIWNWVASQDLTALFENRRYRFSTLKTVINLQNMVLRPLLKFPFWVQWLGKIFPAGLFWWMVIVFNDSSVPWWATFLGSFAFELSQLEKSFFRKVKENPL